jgi:hypothetical protein
MTDKISRRPVPPLDPTSAALELSSPSDRPAHSSTRAAPALAATRTLSTDSTLISTARGPVLRSLCEILHQATIHLATRTRAGTRPTLKSGEAD